MACGYAKLAAEAPARELYAGDLTRKAVAFAAARGTASGTGTAYCIILSALHGVLDLDAVVAPYDTRIDDLTPGELADWHTLIRTQLAERGCEHATIFVHGGKRYVAELARALAGTLARVLPFFNDHDRGPTGSSGIGTRKRYYALLAAREATTPTTEATMNTTHFTYVKGDTTDGAHAFVAQCDCGWAGRKRGAYLLAAVDGARHVDAHDTPDCPDCGNEGVLADELCPTCRGRSAPADHDGSCGCDHCEQRVPAPCSCEWADDIPNDWGPSPYIANADEACPAHGRAAQPDDWARSDAMDAAYDAQRATLTGTQRAELDAYEAWQCEGEGEPLDEQRRRLPRTGPSAEDNMPRTVHSWPLVHAEALREDEARAAEPLDEQRRRLPDTAPEGA